MASTGAVAITRETQTVSYEPITGYELAKGKPGEPVLRRRIFMSPFSARLTMKKPKEKPPVLLPEPPVKFAAKVTETRRNGKSKKTTTKR